MSDLKVNLTQVEKSDLNNIKNVIINNFLYFIDEYNHFCDLDLNTWLDELSKKNPYTFAIRAHKAGDTKRYLVGLCGLWDIDHVNRHANLFFAMVDKDGSKSTFQPQPASFYACNQILNIGFKELGLHKISTVAYEHNEIKKSLEHFGFLPEGIRKDDIYKNGKYRHALVCALFARDFVEIK